MDIFIKYAIIISCSLYTFFKLLHLKACKIIVYKFLIYLFVVLPAIYFLRINAISLSFVFLVITLIAFIAIITKISLNLTITVSIISVGFSYLTFIVAAFPAALIVTLLLRFILPKSSGSYTDVIGVVIACLIQIVLVMISFRIKRLKNGMPFLLENGSSDVGVYVSFTLLIAASCLSMNKDDSIIKLIPFIFIVISGLIVLFWWRKSLTKKYIEKAKSREMQSLQETIAQKDAEIERLKCHNEELSKIIHKDNKLIPALEYAVRQYLLAAESEADGAGRLPQGHILLCQIESASSERRGIITSYESDSKRLPATGVPSVDALLMYMLQRSKELQIDLNLSLSGSVKYLIENIAAEQDINTLLADLIENAIVAVKACASKNILVHIGIVDNCYSMSIFDNGIPFTSETLNDIGLKRTTTHAGEGGSGIGLMTAFEILRKYQASYVIEDVDNMLYTKSVSVCFDHLGQFRIKSKNKEHIEQFSAREDKLRVNTVGA